MLDVAFEKKMNLKIQPTIYVHFLYKQKDSELS